MRGGWLEQKDWLGGGVAFIVTLGAEKGWKYNARWVERRLVASFEIKSIY